MCIANRQSKRLWAAIPEAATNAETDGFLSPSSIVEKNPSVKQVMPGASYCLAASHRFAERAARARRAGDIQRHWLLRRCAAIAQARFYRIRKAEFEARRDRIDAYLLATGGRS